MILSCSASGGSRPALHRCENAEVSLSFMFISYKHVRYIIKQTARLSRERLFNVSGVHIGVIENDITNTAAFLR